MNNMMLHRWMFFWVHVHILASPVTQSTDNQQSDELLWNPISDNVIASADTDIANCVTDSLDNPDKSLENSQNENILRRESQSCSNSQRRIIQMPAVEKKQRILPDIHTTPNREQLEKDIQSLCPYKEFPLLLYCSGPEVVPGYTLFITYTDEDSQPRYIYTLTMNCLNG